MKPDPQGRSQELAALFESLSSSRSPEGTDWQRFIQLVYDELHRLAEHLLHPGQRDRTITPTVLVHEAYISLFGNNELRWENRAHFFGIAARSMRQVLSHHAERARAIKRGGDLKRVTLSTGLPQENRVMDFFELNAALEKLEREHVRMARVCELKIFAGMAAREIAQILEVSKRTVDGDWSLARAWLARELS